MRSEALSRRFLSLRCVQALAITLALSIGLACSDRSAPEDGPQGGMAETAGAAPDGRGVHAVDPAALDAAVDSLLTASARSWNAGDLAGFMRWYRADGATTYIGSTGLIHGRDAISDRYAPLFEPGASRDSLRFENLETRPIGPGLGLATANYVLFRGDSTSAYGIFTLIVQQTPDGWRIVHDHSSALEQ